MSTPLLFFPSSYRDPSGFVFKKEEVLYRQVNKVFREDFDLFINSGCYTAFTKKNWLVEHEIITENYTGRDDWYLTLRP
ncbi:MAG: hypothetical protein WBC06_05510, partial [Chitinophagaceae bacterium]